MRIGILGATSQIAKDLIVSFYESGGEYNITMFSRSPEKVEEQFKRLDKKLSYPNLVYSEFSTENSFDVLINFVGIGDPAQAKEMGAKIFEVTEQYDNLVLDYLKSHSSCKYIFMSSGAVYGGGFEKAVDKGTVAKVDINNIEPSDWYTIAKLYAESKHRAMSDYSIIDIRIFNYFSHTQNVNARFLITDIVRSIQNGTVLKTSSENITRDFITPSDFYRLILSVINSSRMNISIDCYTKSPVDKFSLLKRCQEEFGLLYEIVDSAGVNATGFKKNYFSKYRVPNGKFKPEYDSLSSLINEIYRITKGVRNKNENNVC
ncbi:NAD-dependent epimerase/dehydratase family protein [Marinomonas sp. C2222]|uniref:NAD-dependent epimerase/dehydratase family protein n=1 Tax=Marinomonas sargassi TaxID=2984494 RepID=A0ABT2YPL7_9GAMM|nr:NAD-dependent epimerase/dehydratase family protein [Marinomonas sargassi]MCV2401639.1 NAD-dependent epimerase/dehydratase family protein [Marinomonas sargassi]